ncbi:MAG: protein kinase domain-containing protein, partial [Thermoanaerobaculia bacterium]
KAQMSQDIALTQTQSMLGTPAYMSPEQMRSARTVDPRSDIWSLGCVLYEMVAGRPPFTAATASDLIATILHKEPAPLARYAQEVPAELERIVTKALRKNRDERYQSVKDLGLDLKSLKQHLEFEAERERTAPDPATPPHGSGAVENAETVPLPAALMAPGSRSLLTRMREPRRATAALLALLLAAVGLAYVARSTGWGTSPIDSIAVLPFVNVSGDPSAEYLSDGVSENLIDRLSELPQLKVIAQASAFRYKGKTVDPREVGRALDVRGVLMGRVARRGDDLEVSAELVDARQRTRVWGSRYHRRAGDLQAVQNDIVRGLAEKLHLQAAPGRAERPVTADAQAYEAYLNGRYYARSFNPEDQRKALGYYTRAIDLDPGFAPAYSGIAMFYLVFANSSFLEPREALPKAREAATKAIALDDGLAEAHLALGNLALNDWSWSGTDREYRRAIELSPNLAEAHMLYASYLAALGRTAESLAEVQRAQALDPLGLRQMLYSGIVLQRVRRNDEAIRVLRDLLKIDPESSLAHVVLGYSYAYQGRYAEAITEYREHLRMTGGNNSTLAYMGCALAMSGQRREALALLDKLKAAKDYVSPAELAILYVGLGDREGAFAALERAYREHDLQLRHLKTEQHYDPLRSDPRFNDLLRRVGLTP